MIDAEIKPNEQISDPPKEEAHEAEEIEDDGPPEMKLNKL